MLKSLKKSEFLIVVISLFFTTLISSVVGIAGLLITGKFLGFFMIAFALQFVIFAITNTFIQRKDFIETTKVINEQLEASSKYLINLSCSYCQISNTIPVVLNQENKFKCESCSQINGVKMQFFSTQITTPLKKITMELDEIDQN